MANPGALLENGLQSEKDSLTILTTEHEESVEAYVRRNLGAEVFERLIEPFCSGVYAGNPANLSMKAAFGKVSMLHGLQTATAAIVCLACQTVHMKRGDQESGVGVTAELAGMPPRWAVAG
jgi:Flavin containing amine oxidoreductase